MAEYFFNARKNVATNKMDYASMLAADIADRALSNMRSLHHVGVNPPQFHWTSMGPTATGGRTRAILIDNTDPTHQTIFAGGVSGGIWKSTNGGSTWDNSGAALSLSLNDTLANINVCSIAQDAQGAIYIGTGEGFSAFAGGEGFSTDMIGGGMFKSTNDGATWRLLPNAAPLGINNSGAAWAYINRIAIRPDSFQVIYAATNAGLYVSHDSGAHWRNIIGGNALDVKISGDGSIAVASVNGDGYYCYPKTNANLFTNMPFLGAGHLPHNALRIEFAIAPSDPNRIYASVISTPNFSSAGANGIYMNKTAVSSGNGGYWYEIGPGGSRAFDPYAEPGGAAGDQPVYDNTLGVFPNNETQLLCGGVVLWHWNQLSANDTVGTWAEVSHYSENPADPLAIHPDEHAIVFDQNNSNVVYIGCDGGIYKSTNATNLETGAASIAFQAINRNYNVTQFYTLCFTPYVNPLNGLGIGGGTQDNGSPYINGNSYNPYDGTDMSSGDGAGCAVSALNPNIAYFCSDDGTLERTGNLGSLSFPTIAYTSYKGKNVGADIDSVWLSAAGAGAVCFVFPVALYESAYDTLNLDSLKYIANKNYNAGDTAFAQSQNVPGYTYPYKLKSPLAKGASLEIPDRVVSRLAIGFSPAQGIWMNGQGASNSTVVWMPIAGPNSLPDAYVDGGGRPQIHCLAWSPNGNTLYAGTEDGVFYRFSNINSIVANNYNSGALFYEAIGTGYVASSNKVVSKNLTAALGATNRDILSIIVDPKDSSKVLVTLGNYGQGAYVFYSSDAGNTFTDVQGNLPLMPVYSAILDIRNADGTWNTNAAMIATEHGIYTTSNIASGVWVKNNEGMANCLTLAIKQQTLNPWQCNNSGDIYVGSHGRGLWVSTTNYMPLGVSTVTKPASDLDNLMIYPNPMTTQGNVEFNLSSEDKVTITIYDMQGKEMKTTELGTQSEGNHKVSFNSTGLAAGTYFISLTGTNVRKVSKFIVVK